MQKYDKITGLNGTVQYIRVYFTLHSTETVHPSLQYTVSSTVEQVYRIQSIVR